MDSFGLGSRSWDWKHFIFCSINDSLWDEICKQNPNQSIAIISRLWYDTCFGRNGDLCISLSLWWRWWDFRWGLHQPGISAALQRSFVKVCDVLTTIAAPVMWIESHKTKTRAKKKKKNTLQSRAHSSCRNRLYLSGFSSACSQPLSVVKYSL